MSAWVRIARATLFQYHCQSWLHVMAEEVGTGVKPRVLELMDNGYCSDKQKCDLQRDQEADLNSEHFAVVRGCPVRLVSYVKTQYIGNRLHFCRLFNDAVSRETLKSASAL
jgi:hypothetical protein